MKRLTAIVLSAAGLALCSCGSSAPSLSAFKAGFAANKTSFRRLGLDLQAAIVTAHTRSDAQLATEIGALARRAANQASSLSKLEPPSRYQKGLRELESGFRALSADLSRISVAAAKRNAAGAQAGTVALLHDAARVKAGDVAISSGLHLPPG